MMFMKSFYSLYLAAVVGGLFLSKAVEGFPHGLVDREDDRVFQGSHWVDIWTAMPQLTEPANLPAPPFVSPQFSLITSWIGLFSRIGAPQYSSIPQLDRQYIALLARISFEYAFRTLLVSTTL
jgi:hypothetical protein